MSEEIHSVSPKDYIDANEEIERLRSENVSLLSQLTSAVDDLNNFGVEQRTLESKLADVERENVELCEDYSLSRGHVQNYADKIKLLEAKLAAAEADTKRLNEIVTNAWEIIAHWSDYSEGVVNSWSVGRNTAQGWFEATTLRGAVDLAIDAAKTEVKA